MTQRAAQGAFTALRVIFFGPGGAAQTTSLKSKALEFLRRLKMSVELVIALAALLSWVVVGVVMFDFVEYKAVPGESQTPQMRANVSQRFSDIQQIVTDPVQAVNNAVDEVSSLLNKFQGTSSMRNVFIKLGNT
uniref:Triadin n=1 Tax=Nothobranchius furzeri TaxID=105023 RepID=A0A8C6VV64_NOTFU